MSPTLTPPDPRECENVGELLSWHANGTLGPADRAIVDTHTAACDACRTALAIERRIVDAMRMPRGNVEQSPHAGWQKMVARLDAEGGTVPLGAMVLSERASAEAPKANVSKAAAAVPSTGPSRDIGTVRDAGTARDTRDIGTARDIGGARDIGAARDIGTARETGAGRAGRGRVNWPAALGAAVAVQAAAIAVLAVALVRHRQAEEAPRFHTLASADPTLAASGPLVRIAFDPAVDEAAARGIAKDADARILAGPSPDNVYTFVFADGTDAAGGLDQKVSGLRRHAHVLLVEPVVVGYPRAEK